MSDSVESKKDDTVQYDEKQEATPEKIKFDNELWSIVSNVDPVSGLNLDWLEVREYLCEHGAGKGLEKVFSYYEQHNPYMGSWENFLLACSHFSLEDLEGCAINRRYRRNLELKIKKLIKKRESDKNTPIQEFLYKNSKITV